MWNVERDPSSIHSTWTKDFQLSAPDFLPLLTHRCRPAGENEVERTFLDGEEKDSRFEKGIRNEELKTREKSRSDGWRAPDSIGKLQRASLTSRFLVLGGGVPFWESKVRGMKRKSSVFERPSSENFLFEKHRVCSFPRSKFNIIIFLIDLDLFPPDYKIEIELSKTFQKRSAKKSFFTRPILWIRQSYNKQKKKAPAPSAASFFLLILPLFFSHVVPHPFHSMTVCW